MSWKQQKFVRYRSVQTDSQQWAEDPPRLPSSTSWVENSGSLCRNYVCGIFTIVHYYLVTLSSVVNCYMLPPSFGLKSAISFLLNSCSKHLGPTPSAQTD